MHEGLSGQTKSDLTLKPGWEAAPMPDAALATLVDACRSGAPPAPEPPSDGRVARSYRTNELLVQAVLEILEQDGHLRPTASQVARRAGVSRRALYVHFETIEELIATA